MNSKLIPSIKNNISKVLIGKEHVTELLLTALVANGHVLLEDVPGTGKTVLAKSLAKSMDSVFSRIQFTPDLLPSDVVGLNYYNQKEGEFVFKQGPVFCNILLADEINRATPRTQSSLLECMEEKQVTIDGVTRQLERPFLVIATQNPIEMSGTFPLPEAQMDRFLMRITMGTPTKEEEVNILNRFKKEEPLAELTPVCKAEELHQLQEECRDIFVHPLLIDYIVDLVQSTRNTPHAVTGVSPRGTLALLRASQAFALVQNRKYVVPEDIKSISVAVLAHRLVLNTGVQRENSSAQIIGELLNKIPVPTEDWTK